MKRVLEIFCEICSIPHGSGNMDAIGVYCVRFAKERGLFCHRDEAGNVIIKKEGVGKLKNAPPILLQGHLDMVCQKEEGLDFDFEKEGIQTFIQGDLMRARGTTLGADNGIAVAMVLALLEDKALEAPPIEAVFTTDEEIGMIGALGLSPMLLSAKRMINLDAESDDTVTVSCAGGEDLLLEKTPLAETKTGHLVTLCLKGFQGGHSGVEIHQKRVNAALLCGKILARVQKIASFSTVSLQSGEKSNAIPSSAKAHLLTGEPDLLSSLLREECEKEKALWLDAEKGFDYEISVSGKEEREVLSEGEDKNLYGFFSEAKTGVVAMSQSIEGLVETSCNLGILCVTPKNALIHYSLRSSVLSAMEDLKAFLLHLAQAYGLSGKAAGFYPPWEYRASSPLRDLYSRIYREECGKDIKIEAIHAGLECGVFAHLIPGLDCISVGPNLFDIHSPREAMSLSSVERLYGILKKVLNLCY